MTKATMHREGFGDFIRPTMIERQMGRLMRAPDHGGGDDGKKFTQADIDKAVEKARAGASFTQEDLDAEVQKAVKSAVDEVRKLKADLRRTQEIKPEDMAAIEAENEKLKADLASAQKQAKDATTAAEKAAKALETESGFTQRLLIQDGLKSALIANGVKDEDFIDSLTAKFAGGAKVVIEGEERKAMYGDKPLGDFIKEWAGSDAGKKFVAAAVNSGGGAGGGGGAKGEVRTITRAEYDGLDTAAKTEAGKAAAKGDLKISDAA